MAAPSVLVWDAPPSQTLIPALKTYEERVRAAILQLANYFADRMESYAKQHAPWTDRTTAARQGLRGFAVRLAGLVIIYLVHSVRYGAHLELGTVHAQPYPIIGPTIRAFHAEVMRAARSLVGV